MSSSSTCPQVLVWCGSGFPRHQAGHSGWAPPRRNHAGVVDEGPTPCSRVALRQTARASPGDARRGPADLRRVASVTGVPLAVAARSPAHAAAAPRGSLRWYRRRGRCLACPGVGRSAGRRTFLRWKELACRCCCRHRFSLPYGRSRRHSPPPLLLPAEEQPGGRAVPCPRRLLLRCSHFCPTAAGVGDRLGRRRDLSLDAGHGWPRPAVLRKATIIVLVLATHRLWRKSGISTGAPLVRQERHAWMPTSVMSIRGRHRGRAARSGGSPRRSSSW